MHWLPPFPLLLFLSSSFWLRWVMETGSRTPFPPVPAPSASCPLFRRVLVIYCLHMEVSSKGRG